jgi:hypothetical protein
MASNIRRYQYVGTPNNMLNQQQQPPQRFLSQPTQEPLQKELPQQRQQQSQRERSEDIYPNTVIIEDLYIP